MRGRGLKHHHGAKDDQSQIVAPHAGAWIETLMLNGKLKLKSSPPMRGRGLKLNIYK